MGTQPPPRKRAEPPQFSPHVYCGQTAAWIKMPLGTQVDLGLRAIVLDSDSSPIFGQRPLWPYGWVDYDDTWYGGRPWPRRLCDRWGPRYPRKRARASSPNFGPRLLWPNGWMDENATWYGSRPQPKPHCIRCGVSSSRNDHNSPPLFLAHVYCGHGRPSQLLLSSCFNSL